MTKSPQRRRKGAVHVSPSSSSSSCTQQQTCIQNFFVKKPKKRKLKTTTPTAASTAAAQTTTSLPTINHSNIDGSSGGGGSHPRHAAATTAESIISSNDDNNNNNKNHSSPQQLQPIITPRTTSQQHNSNTCTSDNNSTKTSKNSSSTITNTSNCTNTTKKKKKTKKKKLQQMYLDFGQASFGKRSICKICGMLTVHGLAEDDHEHRKICKDFIHGVPFSISNTSSSSTAAAAAATSAPRVVRAMAGMSTTNSSCRSSNPNKHAKIIEIRPTDSKSLWNKMLQVRAIVDKELGFVSQQSSENSSSSSKKHCRWTTFLFISDKQRVVGLLSAELIRQAFALHDNNCERSTQARKAMLGIHTIWVHSKFRGQGIARQLVDTVREKMVYGLVVPVDQVAFSSPTEAGAKFARSYIAAAASSSSLGRNDDDDFCVLVYDCGSC